MRSLNARVSLSAGLVLAVFVALSAFALERAFRDSARSARQDRLLAQVYLVMAAAEVDTQGRLTLSNGPPEPRLDLPGSGLYATITDSRGSVVWRSRSAVALELPAAQPLAAGVQRFEQIATADGQPLFAQHFGVSWTTSGGSYPFTFSVMEDLAPFEQQLNVYRHSLWSWLGAMAVLLLAVLWLTLRWGLSPLRRVANELGNLEEGRQQQLTGDYPSELRGLTDNLNALLVRERAQRQRYRDALADLAHSLKTPLALMRGSLREGPAAGGSERMLEEQIERMDRIVGYHLQRASTSGRRALAAPQPLRPVVDRLATALAKVHAAKPVDMQVEVDAGLRARVDDGDLTELLGNLLDNAFKWCAGRVRVRAALQDATLTIQVEDDGPGVAPPRAQEVLERGVRADESVPGQGIGLAVVRDIVAAYDGRIEIGHSDLGGARVALTLPQPGVRSTR
jgi:two-component system sensor histidine kinase PhoQ